MKLNELIDDPRTSINESHRAFTASTYRADIAALAKYAFWSDGGGRRSLWEHQKAAISTVVAYLNGD
ncbi:hypothetical protein, partial [Umezakia ovalisporum]|uniref:hypothetical protein n=1 Tax=Umezakia ovalisporum TaxID=75695 RepID=UPI0039C5DD57